MNPQCNRCEKTVYPVEKLSCLDKYWHKGCFNCEVCGMTLTMKTYKGYNKLPYCNTHYPTTKSTVVADTPENRRLAKNAQQQSSVAYHGDFEAEKGQYTAVADDPETLRTRKTQMQSSDLAYQSTQPPPHVAMKRTRAQPLQSAPVPEPSPSAPPSSSGPVYIAIYDYNAADDDEVSIVEGDRIFDVNCIDDGWMEGRVARTGQFGMIPANYVERQ